MKKGNSFQEMKFGGKVAVITSIGFLILVTLVIVVGAYFFGFVGFFNIFNVEYESIGSLFLFLIFFLIFGFITDFVAQAFLVVAAIYFKDKYKIITMKIVLEILFTWLAIFVVNEMIASIIIPLETQLVLAFLLVLADLIFDGKKKSRKVRVKIKGKKDE